MIRPSPASSRDSYFPAVVVCLLLVLPAMLGAQGIRGIVYDETSRSPLPDVVVAFFGGDSLLMQSITDTDGRYALSTGMVRRIRLVFSAAGYAPAEVSSLLLDGYTVLQVDQGMSRWTVTLDEVAVSATTPARSPFVRTIRADDFLRVAGHYDDPVRVAHSLPGIVLTNDQANHFSFRGQSPALNTWMVEGLEVVNPNHLNNAGTFSDRPALSGGGVNLFSAQVLGEARFHTGPSGMSIGRNSGAVIDLRLRESPVPEWRAKAGLLGFELGGTTRLHPTLFLDGNLRYSFTGLLAGLGADFGGEKIGFYDGVYNLRWSGPRHTLKVFGWAGRSDNDFDRVEVPEDRERYKDFFNIEYGNTTFGQGITYLQTLSPSTGMRTGVSYSVLDATYRRNGQFGPVPVNLREDTDQQVLSTYLEFVSALTSSISWTAGINYLNRDMGESTTLSSPFLPESTLRPYTSADIRIGPALRVEAGADMTYNIPDETWYPGGSLRISHAPSTGWEWWSGVRYGTGQRVTAFNETGQAGLLSALNVQIGARRQGTRHTWTHQLFYHRTGRMVIGLDPDGTRHLADFMDGDWAEFNLIIPDGRSRQFGWEGSWRFTSDAGWSLDVNQTLMGSQRSFLIAEPGPGRFATVFATHVMAAREFYTRSRDKDRIWHLSLRALVHGGLREPVIDPEASAAAETTVYVTQYFFTERLPAYTRLDLTISRTISGPAWRLRWALDIQNVLGLRNAAFRYYDPYLGRVETQHHLGIIPVLSVQLSRSGKR